MLHVQNHISIPFSLASLDLFAVLGNQKNLYSLFAAVNHQDFSKNSTTAQASADIHTHVARLYTRCIAACHTRFLQQTLALVAKVCRNSPLYSRRTFHASAPSLSHPRSLFPAHAVPFPLTYATLLLPSQGALYHTLPPQHAHTLPRSNITPIVNFIICVHTNYLFLPRTRPTFSPTFSPKHCHTFHTLFSTRLLSTTIYQQHLHHSRCLLHTRTLPLPIIHTRDVLSNPFFKALSIARTRFTTRILSTSIHQTPPHRSRCLFRVHGLSHPITHIFLPKALSITRPRFLKRILFPVKHTLSHSYSLCRSHYFLHTLSFSHAYTPAHLGTIILT